MNIFKTIKSRFTMERERFLFTDKIAGVPVNKYKDCYGTKWMATSSSPFAWRTKAKEETNKTAENG